MPKGIVGFSFQQAHTVKQPEVDGQKGTKQIGDAKPKFGASIADGLAAPFKALGQKVSDLGHNIRFRMGDEAFTAKTQKKIDAYVTLRDSGTADPKHLADAKAEIKERLTLEFERSPLGKAAEKAPDDQFQAPGSFITDSVKDIMNEGIRHIMIGDRFDKFVDSGLKIDQAVSIQVYTTNCYMAINAELRGGHPSPLMHELADACKAGLAALPKYDDQQGKAAPAAYRTAAWNDTIDAKYQRGNMVSDAGLMSTTSNVDFTYIGDNPPTHCLTIKVSEDTKGRDVAWLSASKNESEILFPPGTQFVVALRDTPGMLPKSASPSIKDMVGVVLVEYDPKIHKPSNYSVRDGADFRT